MNTPAISVIVPIYKAEAYLRKCVDGILCQSFSDFELILVDDGSPDLSGAICDDYARKDSRVRVVHKPNGGLTSARRSGQAVARGHYTLQIDPDDWVEPIMLAPSVLISVNCSSRMMSCGSCGWRRIWHGWHIWRFIGMLSLPSGTRASSTIYSGSAARSWARRMSVSPSSITRWHACSSRQGRWWED